MCAREMERHLLKSIPLGTGAGAKLGAAAKALSSELARAPDEAMYTKDESSAAGAPAAVIGDGAGVPNVVISESSPLVASGVEAGELEGKPDGVSDDASPIEIAGAGAGAIAGKPVA